MKVGAAFVSRSGNPDMASFPFSLVLSLPPSAAIFIAWVSNVGPNKAIVFDYYYTFLKIEHFN
jgi:hypothetical protein